ncbi:MAG: TIGR00730 family Rossman fold protein [Microbacteriaceae bacterium]
MEHVNDEALFQAVNINDAPEQWIDGIAQEMRNGFAQLSRIQRGVSVFGSARPKAGSDDYELGVQVGKALAEQGYDVITGGGPGLMEAANRGASLVGGVSVGLGIELPHEQGFNEFVNLGVPFQHFFTRKLMFVRYAKAYVVLPGGFGTMDELFEALTLIQTDKIHDFPVVLMGTSFWNPLLTWFEEQLVMRGYIHQADLRLFTVTDDIQLMLKIVRAFIDADGTRSL